MVSCVDRYRRRRDDITGLAVLGILTALVAWNRLTFDAWLGNWDVQTFYTPWYAHLGDRLRSFDVPGWNPYVFSGTPFAGDPQSGWMYLPAMLCFTFLGAVPAFKAFLIVQLAIATVSTYAFVRVLGMGVAAALVASVAYGFGPFLQWSSYGIMIFAQLATWIPVALLGIELALRAETWRARMVPWSLAGFAISQMLAGWLGQGVLYGFIVIGSYLAYRSVLASPVTSRNLRIRVVMCLTTGIAIFGLGLALGAAGLLPRIDVNAETNLAGGDYEALGAAGATIAPWRLDDLLYRIMWTGFRARTTVAMGGAILVLSLLAPFLARRRFAVSYFAVLTVVSLVLTLDTTILHRLFYLIPRFRTIHEHDPGHAAIVTPMGAAVLAAATVESLLKGQGRWRLAPVGLTVVIVASIALVLSSEVGFVGWSPLLAAFAALTLVAVYIVKVGCGRLRSSRARIAAWVPALLLAVAFIQPTGLELSGTWFGSPRDASWAPYWYPDPSRAESVAVYASRIDPGGAGEFLQARMAESEPFRYVGYGGYGHPSDEARRQSYMNRRRNPNVSALLVNGRSIFLGLSDIQGYNPVQLRRYVEFMTAVNGQITNYHIAYLLPSGVESPLLDLLNVRYVVVDASLPVDRDDVVALTAGLREVFRNDFVIIYENERALPRAWLVHDVRTVIPGEALPLLTSGTIDVRRTAVVEGNTPPTRVPDSLASESVRVTHVEPDAMTISVNASAPGLLVISEVYSSGWRAYVDGDRVEITPTDHVLRGVPIPAGEHDVKLRYEPTSLRIGLVISALSTALVLIGCAALGWARIRRLSDRWSSPPPDNALPHRS